VRARTGRTEIRAVVLDACVGRDGRLRGLPVWPVRGGREWIECTATLPCYRLAHGVPVG